MEKSLKSLKSKLKKFAVHGVATVLGVLALAMILQHIITFMLLGLIQGSMFYILWRYNYA